MSKGDFPMYISNIVIFIQRKSKKLLLCHLRFIFYSLLYFILLLKPKYILGFSSLARNAQVNGICILELWK